MTWNDQSVNETRFQITRCPSGVTPPVVGESADCAYFSIGQHNPAGQPTGQVSATDPFGAIPTGTYRYHVRSCIGEGAIDPASSLPNANRQALCSAWAAATGLTTIVGTPLLPTGGIQPVSVVGGAGPTDLKVFAAAQTTFPDTATILVDTVAKPTTVNTAHTELSTRLVAADLVNTGTTTLTKKIQVDYGDGRFSTVAQFSILPIQGQTPGTASIAFVNPDRGDVSGGYNVRIVGANFAPGATVTFDTASATVNWPASTSQSLVVTVPAHAAGPVTVTVKNPNQAPVSKANAFTYFTSTQPAPVVTSLSASSGPTSGGTSVTLTGSGFQTNAMVTFAHYAAEVLSIYDSGTKIDLRTPVAGAGTVPVTVLNPDGQSGALPAAFTFNPPAGDLRIRQVVPASGPTTGGTAVYLDGQYFPLEGTMSAEFSGSVVPASQVIVSQSGSRADLATPSHAAGWTDVKVVVPGVGTNEQKNAFAYLGPLPTLTGVTPQNGAQPMDAGGTTVTLTGANFVTGATVSFGGLAALSVSFVSASQLTAVTPAHAAGSVDVTVANPGQQGVTLVGGYTYKMSPPTDFNLVSTGSTNLNLGWSIPAASYDSALQLVWVRQGQTDYHLVNLPAHSTGKDLTGLTADTGYYLWLRSFSGNVYSDWAFLRPACTGCPAVSGVLIAVTAGGSVPAKPTNHVKGTVTTTSIQTTWTDIATNEQTYQVAYGQLSGGAVAAWLFTDLAANTTSWNHANLTTGATWLYFVKACRWVIQCSDYSDGVIATAATTPPMPVNFAANPLSNKVTLTWDRGAGVTEEHFEVVWSPVANADYHLVTLPTGTLLWLHTGVSYPQQFYYWVRACAWTECSAYAGALMVSVPPPYDAPLGTVSPTATRSAASTPTPQGRRGPVPAVTARPTAIATLAGGSRPASGSGDPPPPPANLGQLPPHGVTPPSSRPLAELVAALTPPDPALLTPAPINVTEPPSVPGPVPSPTPTPSPTATPSPSVTPTPGATATITPRAGTSPTATSTPAATVAPAATVTPTPISPRLAPSPTPVATSAVTPTASSGRPAVAPTPTQPLLTPRASGGG